jgi:FkbM family methyltransferase
MPEDETRSKLESKIIEITKELSAMNMNPSMGDDRLHFDYDGLNVSFETEDDFELLSALLCVDGTFCSDRFKLLNVRGKNVVDIGTYIGDTAIKFAMDGAAHVYSFETYPRMYEKALRNVKANGLQEKITVTNKGVCRDGAMKIDPAYRSRLYSPIRNFDAGVEVETLSLRSLVDRYQIPRGSALNSNCEGCEYDFIMEADAKDLSVFGSMMIEYHYGPEELAKKLDQSSFNVAYVQPEYFRNSEAEDKDMYRGAMFARFVPEELVPKYKQDIIVVPQSS